MHQRADRIRKTLMKEISEIIRKDVKDARISGIVSITDIELSPDYSHAKVFISVFGSDEVKEQTLEALEEASPQVRYAVGKRVRLRHIPEIVFKLDDSLERGSRITQLIDKISKGEI